MRVYPGLRFDEGREY